MNWERLRILRQVLEDGSYARAARQLGVSQPTVRRQVKALEGELGETLVLTTPAGIEPTAAARRMLPDLDHMARTADRLSRLPSENGSAPVVRIACGPWVGLFLCQNLLRLTGEPPDCSVEIASGVVLADMPRREADLAVRMQRPEVSDLRSRVLPHFRYAAYGARTLVDDKPEAFDERRYAALPWAMMTDELDHLPTAKWLLSRQVETVTVRCTHSTHLQHAVRSGAALAVLPCFVGDADPDLCRVCGPFLPEGSSVWLVLPDDARRKPHNRTVADRLIRLFETEFG